MAAREAYKDRDVEYFDVKASREAMEAMLAASGGKRAVPVIVDGDRVEVGYGGS